MLHTSKDLNVTTKKSHINLIVYDYSLIEEIEMKIAAMKIMNWQCTSSLNYTKKCGQLINHKSWLLLASTGKEAFLAKD